MFPFWTLFRKEVHRFLKVINQTVGAPFVNSALYLLIFGVSLGKSIQDYHGYPYLAFLIPGLMMMSLLNNSFQNSSSSIVGSKFHGDLQDLKIVPLSSLQIVWAMSLGALVRGLVVATVTITVSEVFYLVSYGKFLIPSHPFMLLAFCVIGGLTFGTLGIFVGFISKTFEHLNAVGSFILLPLLYLGGVFFSISTLHPFWQKVSQINPLLYFINGVRYGFLGVSDIPVGSAFAVSVLSLILLQLCAMYSVRRGSFQRW
ncbi:MAG: ABC transporter permease [Bdellovibrionales bacterium CG10_big_fil_rev_8_21_14_0_10_45_34]|nr:MAG: ABC transporter permease [Bdellovibrionales bacterium CG10_big_fil_rev_8_21_14_0_10_45_34]